MTAETPESEWVDIANVAFTKWDTCKTCQLPPHDIHLFLQVFTVPKENQPSTKAITKDSGARRGRRRLHPPRSKKATAKSAAPKEPPRVYCMTYHHAMLGGQGTALIGRPSIPELIKEINAHEKKSNKTENLLVTQPLVRRRGRPRKKRKNLAESTFISSLQAKYKVFQDQLTEAQAKCTLSPAIATRWRKNTLDGAKKPSYLYRAPCSFLSAEFQSIFPLLGLRTSKFIKKGTFLGFYTGKHMETHKYEDDLKAQSYSTWRLNLTDRNSYSMNVVSEFYWNSEMHRYGFVVDAYEGGYLRYINTACVGEWERNNVYSRVVVPPDVFEPTNGIPPSLEELKRRHKEHAEIAFFALRDILPDEELLVYYGPCFWYSRLDYERMILFDPRAEELRRSFNLSLPSPLPPSTTLPWDTLYALLSFAKEEDYTVADFRKAVRAAEVDLKANK